MELLLAMGIPTAITGMMVWWIQRRIEERESKLEEQQKSTEKLMMMIMQTSRATNVLAEATARAVQRIPDAHCNGDMKSALERAASIQKEEQEFLINQGVKHVFGGE